jgi:preprotein translocase subunit SecD
MIFWYRGSGVLAVVAMVLQIFLLLAGLAALRGTLTVPGIAGIILTIGMAVDANVLIYERIREEIRNHKTVRAAIDAGYSRAFITIFDSNLTTLIAALVLFQYGTGPIKGFAVTLSIGIVANMLTAVLFTRMVFDLITSRRRLETLSI